MACTSIPCVRSLVNRAFSLFVFRPYMERMVDTRVVFPAQIQNALQSVSAFIFINLGCLIFQKFESLEVFCVFLLLFLPANGSPQMNSRVEVAGTRFRSDPKKKLRWFLHSWALTAGSGEW